MVSLRVVPLGNRRWRASRKAVASYAAKSRCGCWMKASVTRPSSISTTTAIVRDEGVADGTDGAAGGSG